MNGMGSRTAAKQEAGSERAFRADINGLRGWAVLAVVLFHFGAPGFEGGFVGVDVFFVISGYLMTGIVVRSHERGQFALISFYLARARRIMPALWVLCVALLILGGFALVPEDYFPLARQTFASLGFWSNLLYASEAGYFDAESHEKWLLHTWSLSVEWQFYMLLPIVMMAVWRTRPGRMAQGIVLGCAATASLAASILLTASDPGLAFFALSSRAWELLFGGLIAVSDSPVPKTWRRPLSWLGLALIVAAIALCEQHGWPGIQAMLPVLGAGLIIAAAGQTSLTNHWLPQWLGERSYSIYLHIPRHPGHRSALMADSIPL